jgi:hypothetical protein
VTVVRDTVAVALIATGVLAATIFVAPGRTELALHLWFLVLVGLGAALILVLLRRAVPPPRGTFDTALEGQLVEASRPASLARVERELSLATQTAFDAHRLRPRLTGVAAGLLASRSGIDLTREPERARAVLGDEAWELVRPADGPPADREGPGVDPGSLQRTIVALEELAWS